jgi:diguanylate cyclase (GGDEF)-like protein
MKRDWYRFYRGLRDRRSLVLDLLSLLGLAVFAGLIPLVFDWPSSASKGGDVGPPGLLRWVIWLAAMGVGVLVFALRRCLELERALTRADTDALTLTLSRGRIQHVLETEFSRATRYRRSLSVVMVRVDGFSQIVAVHGHQVADRVLYKVAHRMRRRLRTTDYLGRWAEDTFLIVGPETDLSEAAMLSTRMRRAIKSQAMGHVGIVTACLGICPFSGQSECEALLTEAEGWLLQAQSNGIDQVSSRLDQRADIAGST